MSRYVMRREEYLELCQSEVGVFELRGACQGKVGLSLRMLRIKVLSTDGRDHCLSIHCNVWLC